jgi:Fur family transcriptional regulator, ferric uptake regulator
VIRSAGRREHSRETAVRERRAEGDERLGMTVPHDTRPLAAASAPAALATLRARGLRITRSRRVVVEALFAADAPVGAEQIAGGLGGRVPRTDLASVYRNLEALERAGLVRHVHAGHGAGRYALASRRDDGYAACEHCGVLAPLDLDSVIRVEAIVAEACGFEARLVHFPVVGRCPRCKSTPRIPEVHHAHS